MPLRPGITLDQMNHRGDGRLPGLMGFRVTALEDGMLAAELDIRPELLAPNGYLHAATVIALADTACGYGCIAHLPAGQAFMSSAVEIPAEADIERIFDVAPGRLDAR